MATEPVEKLVCKLAVPTICSVLVTSLYNMADTFFVAGLQNDSITGAVGIAFPLMSIIQAMGFTFGHGSGNFISRKLGSRESDLADRMASIGFFSALIFGGVFMLLGLLFLGPLVRLLGATPTIEPYARDYVFYILIGTPYMTAALVLNNQLRFQGNAAYAMVGIVSGAILNIGLDPILIYTLDMGIAGAALATIISQFVSFVLLLGAYRTAGVLHLSWKQFRPTRHLYAELLRGGMPSLWRQGLASLATVVLNHAAGPFGDVAVTAMTVVTRIDQLALSVMIGFGQGFQPVCGYNYGAGLYRRVRRAFYFCVAVSAAFLLVTAGVLFGAAPQILAVFSQDGPEVLTIGAEILRCHALSMPLMSWIIMSNMMLQTIGHAGSASLLAAARQGLFLIPALLLMTRFFGLPGLEWSQTVSDVCSFLLALPIGLYTLRSFRHNAP